MPLIQPPDLTPAHDLADEAVQRALFIEVWRCYGVGTIGAGTRDLLLRAVRMGLGARPIQGRRLLVNMRTRL